MNKIEIMKSNLPQFILFKNLKFKETSITFDIDEIESGEIIASHLYLSELTKLVPNPTYPSSPSKQHLFEDKFGDGEYVDFSFNTSPYALINIDPEDVERTPDSYIFGESYTILWVCSTDIKHKLKVLMQLTKELAKSTNRKVADIFDTIWNSCIDDLSVATDIKDFDSMDFISDLKQLYEKELAKLADGRKQKA